jgi:hypothetical protein
VEKVESFSPSRIGAYRRCPLQEFYRYKGGIVLKPNGNLVLGSSGHAGLEHNAVFKMEHGDDAPLDEVLDAYSDKFNELAQDADFTDEDPGAVKDEGAALVALHMEEVAPTIMPVEIETWLDIDFENKPYRVHQRGDVITVDGRVVDYKFKGRRMDVRGAAIDYQLSSYALAYKLKYGEDPTEVVLACHIRGKKPGYQPVTATRGQRDYDRMLNILDHISSSILANVYWPCDNIQVCSWCGYKPLCWGKPWQRYILEPELAQQEAKRLIAQKLAVGKVETKKEEDTLDE